MARIPTYERRVDGSAGTLIDLPRANPENFGAQIGRSVERLGIMVSAEAEADQRAKRNAAVTDAGRRVAEAEAALATTKAKGRRAAAADGAGHLETAMKRFGDVEAATLEGISDPEVRGWAETQLVKMRSRYAEEEGGYAEGLRASKVVSDFAGGRDIAANNLFTAPSFDRLSDTLAAQDAMVKLLDVPADVREKIGTETAERLTLSYAQGLAEADPYALRQQIDDGGLNAMLPPDKLAVLRNRADTEIRGREMAAKAEARERRAMAAAAERQAREDQRDYETSVRDTARDYIDLMKSGVAVPEGEVAALAGAAARIRGGGALVRQIGRLSEQNAVTVALRGAPPRVVQDAVVELRGKMNTAEGPTRMLYAAQLEAAEAKLTAMTSAINTDTLAFAQAEGVTALAPLDVADADSVRARLTAANKTKARYGGGLRVLTETEADEWSARLGTGTPEQKAAALMELQQLGPQGAAAALRQISPKQPVLAHAGLLMGTPGRAYAARQMLKGLDALSANSKLLPVDDVQGEVAAAAGTALRFLPDLTNILPDAARAYGAGFAASNGLTRLTGRQVRQSLNAVAGATRGNDGVMRGGFGERSGVTVLLPATKSGAEFNQALDTLSVANQPEAARPVLMRRDGTPGATMTDEQLRRAVPFAVGNGRYVLALDDAGEQIIMRRDGRRFEVVVK